MSLSEHIKNNALLGIKPIYAGSFGSVAALPSPASSYAGYTASVNGVPYFCNGVAWSNIGSGSADTVITQKDPSGNVSQYTEAGIVWNITYDSNGDFVSLLRG